MPAVDVYADLLFLINAAMDGLCLMAAARLCHRPLRGGRIALATVLGGVYAVPVLLLPGGQWLSLLVDVGVCLLMCAIAFGRRRLISVTLLYIGLSMALGGVMTALYNLLNQSGLAALIPATEEGVGTWLFLILGLGSLLVTLRGGHFLRRTTATRTCTVTVTLSDRTITLPALVDTGNLLTDPLDGRPVICMDKVALSPLLSPALRRAADDMTDGHIPPPDTLADLPEAPRLRLVPATAATGEGLLLALRPDRVTLAPMTGTPRRRAPREVDALIALIPPPAGDMQALVPALLWQGTY